MSRLGEWCSRGVHRLTDTVDAVNPAGKLAEAVAQAEAEHDRGSAIVTIGAVVGGYQI